MTWIHSSSLCNMTRPERSVPASPKHDYLLFSDTELLESEQGCWYPVRVSCICLASRKTMAWLHDHNSMPLVSFSSLLLRVASGSFSSQEVPFVAPQSSKQPPNVAFRPNSLYQVGMYHNPASFGIGAGCIRLNKGIPARLGCLAPCCSRWPCKTSNPRYMTMAFAPNSST